MKKDFLELKKYYREAAAKLPDDSVFMDDINHKFKHSVEVLHIGRTILKQTPELSDRTVEFSNFAEKALLFHYVGRFTESTLRYTAQNSADKEAPAPIYDHSLIGFELLKQNPLYNDIRILLAVRFHGSLMRDVKNSPLWQQAEDSPHFQNAEKILYLVRDADKLSILHSTVSENRLMKDPFYRQLTPEALNAPLSENVLQQFMNQQNIVSSTVYSFADRLLYVLSWIFDFNYQKTRQIFRQKAYARYLLDLLTQYHKNESDIKTIEQLAKQYL